MNEPDPQRVAEIRSMFEGMTRLSLGLETPCWACLGHPDYKQILENCSYCNGIGYLLTQRGKELARFLIRHVIRDLSSQVREILEEEQPK